MKDSKNALRTFLVEEVTVSQYGGWSVKLREFRNEWQAGRVIRTRLIKEPQVNQAIELEGHIEERSNDKGVYRVLV